MAGPTETQLREAVDEIRAEFLSDGEFADRNPLTAEEKQVLAELFDRDSDTVYATRAADGPLADLVASLEEGDDT